MPSQNPLQYKFTHTRTTSSLGDGKKDLLAAQGINNSELRSSSSRARERGTTINMSPHAKSIDKKSYAFSVQTIDLGDMLNILIPVPQFKTSTVMPNTTPSE